MSRLSVGADSSAMGFVGAASAAKGASARATILALALCVVSLTTHAQTPPHDTFTLATTAPAETRHINVYKPPGYDVSGDHYPVLYMPDGGLQEDFPHVAKALDEGIRAGEIQPVILVGIENTERRRDMTGPTSVASDKQIALHVGGSASFRAFFANRLIPEIGMRYRVDGHRGIMGESLAGLFSVESFLREPTLFDTAIAISPSLWWNHAGLVDEAPLLVKGLPSGPRQLFLTSADEDNIGPSVAKLDRTLGYIRPQGLRWTYVPRPEQHHDTIYLASERYALRWAYPPRTPARPRQATARKVLFLGNSLTYVNDLPSAFASLAAEGESLSVDMIAQGGASLADAAHDPMIARAIVAGGYTDVILQERGGEAFCPVTCQERGTVLPAQASAEAVAAMARAAGARVYYLGTWQTSRETNAALEYGERAIARVIGATYIEIAERRRRLLEVQPTLAWTHADGQHPGYATTAMMALRTWQAVFGEAATGVPCVSGEVHYHAPMPGGIWHVDASAMPRTCLVSRNEAKRLAN
jgi:predicted alpha/beta superfamily hydrolase